MNKLPDRAKMRREYLAIIATANLQKLVGVILMYGCGIVAGLSAVILLMCAIAGMLNGGLPPAIIGSSVVFLFFFGVMAFKGSDIVRAADEKERSTEYIPPVHEQIAMLPAEEILLRGSQASTATSEELLRPAGMQETRAEGLLRAASGSEPE